MAAKAKVKDGEEPHKDQIHYRNCAAVAFLDNEIPILKEFRQKLKKLKSFKEVISAIDQLCPYYGIEFSQELTRLHGKKGEFDQVLKDFYAFVEKRIEEERQWQKKMKQKYSFGNLIEDLVRDGRQYIWSIFCESESALLVTLQKILHKTNKHSIKKTVFSFFPHFEFYLRRFTLVSERNEFNQLIAFVSERNVILKSCVKKIRSIKT